ncbi:unnamed protein product [Thlaspi arvense]|uniref:PORR domain-containing protein n=1 Tax=Thlaspi arvense TaxID=13288 RepID=A0AAU9RMG3_THLAR|nr:unnamed protein product [Thlaspi arvense]
MQSIFRSFRRRIGHQESRRTLVDLTAIKWVRDRGLDHAVEKESNLQPMLNLKNLIKSEPSKSLPLSIIVQNRESLDLPLRPIEFVRKYPSVFEEFFPGGVKIHPHVKLTQEILGLDADEQLIYQSDDYKQRVADRLLKLLMLAGIHKIPIRIIDRLRWDLGLPQDYIQSVVPEFPDYFKITRGSDSDLLLELVCWSSELAVSAIQKRAMSGEVGYKKGMAISFPLQYSRGFEVDKKFKRWVDEWQKLPYVSPYENALHFPAKSDEADKWAVAVMHEILTLLIGKKTDRENVLCLGEYWGLRARFKRALLHHPGIFYLSNKIGTHTVVLRDGYKRNLLIEKHPFMDMRYKYIHLMNTVKEDKKPKAQKQKPTIDSTKEGEEMQVDTSEDEQFGELNDLSGSEVEYGSDEDYDDEEDKDDAGGYIGRAMKNPNRSLRTSVATNLKTRKTVPVQVSGKIGMHGKLKGHSSSPGRGQISRNRGRSNLRTGISV